jgi:hypothetical protein
VGAIAAPVRRFAASTSGGCAVAAGIAALLLCGVVPARAAALTLQADPFLQQGEKLTSSELTAFAEQGSSVALSADGDTALVGAPGYKGFAGAVWVYTRSGSIWTEQAKLVGEEGTTDAHQGFSVALSADGDTALIGGPDEEAGGQFPGAAWVFTRSGTTWSEQGKMLIGTGGSSHPQQGWSVALSADGDTALIGGPENAEAGSAPGAAWVYTRSGSIWTQQGKLVGVHPKGVVDEGWSVALSGDGDTALIGGPSAEVKAGEPALGAAWMFARTGSTWNEQEKLPAGTGAGEKTAQGESVALSGSGDTALVGGAGYDKNVGAAWAYTLAGGKWTQQGEKLLGEDESTEAQEGHSVALSENGNTALIGGFHNDTSVGAAWAFVRSGSTWSEQEKLEGLGSMGGFPTQGSSVALSGDGDTALVGGAGDNGEVGAAWVFARASGSESETKKEPETKEPEGKGSSNSGSGGGGASGSMSAGTSGSSLGTASSSTGIATTPQAIEELRLGCSKRSLVLNDVLIHGGRVALEGSAAKSLVGKRVKIVFDGRAQVATATVAADGEFATTAPLPPARLRNGNSARYMAEEGGLRSLDLKLTRRLSLEPPVASGGAVTLAGQVLPPLTKPVAAVSVQQQLECGKTTIVKRFTPSASGRFHITVQVPAGAKAGIYRLIGSVAVKPGSKRGFATYSLPLPVILG